jgi:hypothetical protein
VELRLARDELQRVEERFTELCSAPFYRQDGGGRDLLKQTEKLNTLERSSKEKDVQIEHLQVTERDSGDHNDHDMIMLMSMSMSMKMMLIISTVIMIMAMSMPMMV